MMKKTWLMMLVMMLLITFNASAARLKSGPWRFELQTENATIPFIVELKLNGKKLSGKINNGEESIPLDNIVYTKNKLKIPLQTYEITMELVQESPTLVKGFWIRHNKNPKIEIPIVGIHGQTERFSGKKDRPKANLNGKWAIELLDSQNQKSPGVAIFKQQGNHLTGSILTPTGDYRYLEGYVSGNEFEAASFDGMFNYLFKGKLVDEKLEAAILSTYVTKISGKRDADAQLPDAYAATKMATTLDFNFPDLKGKKISLNDPKFKDRAVIVQFFGSWCPNCLDEMNYLVPWYGKNKNRGIEIVALAFERSLSDGDAKRQLTKVQKKNALPYTLLVAGTTPNDKPMEKIQGLKNFISFPTLLFLNKKHEVVKIHAGFTGPSTGEFFDKWKEEFNQTVNGLLKVKE